MWTSMICVPSPIVLAFLMDHFLPLSCRSRNSSESSSSVYAVPLVTASMEPLRVHFLLPSEENGAHLLLQQYLELLELQTAGENGCDAVLAAKVVTDDASFDYRHRPITTVRNVIFHQNDFFQKCTTENCEFQSMGSTGMCLLCSMSCFPYKSLVDDALRGWFEGATLSQCANVGCNNESWLPSGGLCRLCSFGCYPRHYDMPLSLFVSEFRQQFTTYGMCYWYKIYNI